MTSPTASPVRPSARLRGAVALAAAVLAFPAALPATAPAHRLPLYVRLQSSLFPANDPGYLPLVGTPPLRFHEAEPPRHQITPPPVVLYAPPTPAATQPATTPGDGAAILPQPSVATQPAPVAADRKPPPLRPEDFLPYFQLNDGSARGTTGEGLQFTPARPELPTSRADYRQQ